MNLSVAPQGTLGSLNPNGSLSGSNVIRMLVENMRPIPTRPEQQIHATLVVDVPRDTFAFNEIRLSGSGSQNTNALQLQVKAHVDVDGQEVELLPGACSQCLNRNRPQLVRFHSSSRSAGGSIALTWGESPYANHRRARGKFSFSIACSSKHWTPNAIEGYRMTFVLSTASGSVLASCMPHQRVRIVQIRNDRGPGQTIRSNTRGGRRHTSTRGTSEGLYSNITSPSASNETHPIKITRIYPAEGKVDGGTQITLTAAFDFDPSAQYTVHFGSQSVQAQWMINCDLFCEAPPTAHPHTTVVFVTKSDAHEPGSIVSGVIFRYVATQERNIPELTSDTLVYQTSTSSGTNTYDLSSPGASWPIQQPVSHLPPTNYTGTMSHGATPEAWNPAAYFIQMWQTPASNTSPDVVLSEAQVSVDIKRSHEHIRLSLNELVKIFKVLFFSAKIKFAFSNLFWFVRLGSEEEKKEKEKEKAKESDCNPIRLKPCELLNSVSHKTMSSLLTQQLQPSQKRQECRQPLLQSEFFSTRKNNAKPDRTYSVYLSAFELPTTLKIPGSGMLETAKLNCVLGFSGRIKGINPCLLGLTNSPFACCQMRSYSTGVGIRQTARLNTRLSVRSSRTYSPRSNIPASSLPLRITQHLLRH